MKMSIQFSTLMCSSLKSERHTCTDTDGEAYRHRWMDIYVYLCVCLFVFVCVCINIYMFSSLTHKVPMTRNALFCPQVRPKRHVASENNTFCSLCSPEFCMEWAQHLIQVC